MTTAQFRKIILMALGAMQLSFDEFKLEELHKRHAVAT
jgi:hypothetical protein